MLCDLSFREDSLPVKRQKLERYQLFMLEPEVVGGDQMCSDCESFSFCSLFLSSQASLHLSFLTDNTPGEIQRDILDSKFIHQLRT